MKNKASAIIGRLGGEQSGYIMIMAVFTMMLLLLIGVVMAVTAVNEVALSKRSTVMDQAYSLAEVGIDRGAMAVSANEAQSPNSPYGVGKSTATGVQWTSEENWQQGSAQVSKYKVDIYQDDNFPSMPEHKRIRAKGTYSYGTYTAERTIESKMLVPIMGKEYDAAFDYCVFNGMNYENGQGTWPGDQNGDGSNDKFTVGQFTWDGATPFNGHSPKGAIYTRGSIWLEATGPAVNLTVNGNMVATDNVVIRNNWPMDNVNGGITVNSGNVIAGLDGSGNAELRLDNAYLFSSKENVSVNGGLEAGTDAWIMAGAAININNPVHTNYIKAGGSVYVSGSAQLAKATETGAITAGVGVAIDSGLTTGGISTGAIRSGQGSSQIPQVFDWTLVQRINKSTAQLQAKVGTDAAKQYSGVRLQSVFSSITVGGAINTRGQVYESVDFSNVTTQEITAGNNMSASDTDGTGFYADINWFSGLWGINPPLTGNITSAGKVVMYADVASQFTTGNITAGKNTSDNQGVNWAGDMFSKFTSGSVTAVGDIVATNSDGTSLTTGGLWSGGNIDMNSSANWVSDIGDCSMNITGSPAVKAAGYCKIYSADNVYVRGGDITVVGSIDMKSIQTSFLGGNNRIWVGRSADDNTAYNIYSGGSTTLQNNNWLLDCSGHIGNIYSVGNIYVQNNDPAKVGTFYAGNSDNVSTLYFSCDANTFGGDSSAGNMWGTGKVTIHHNETIAGDLYMGVAYSPTCVRFEPFGDALYGTDIYCNNGTGGSISAQTYEMQDGRSWGNVEPNGGHDFWGTTWYPPPTGNPGSNTGVAVPTVSAPSQPAKPAAPTVGHGNAGVYDIDLLRDAGLDAPIMNLEPSWGHFKEKSLKDDAQAPPGSGAHYLMDTGGSGPVNGDYDGVSGNGEIEVRWDSTKYSSNETLYNDNPDKDLIIKKVSFPADPGGTSKYVGTIVSRGNVYIECAQADIRVETSQQLNIAAGLDLARRTSGFSLVSKNNCQYHFYAGRNIDLSNMQFSGFGANTFYGSFTAGNRVLYRSNNIWENTTFRWSRWDIDPVGWVPSYKVLSWREI